MLHFIKSSRQTIFIKTRKKKRNVEKLTDTSESESFHFRYVSSHHKSKSIS